MKNNAPEDFQAESVESPSIPDPSVPLVQQHSGVASPLSVEWRHLQAEVCSAGGAAQHTKISEGSSGRNEQDIHNQSKCTSNGASLCSKRLLLSCEFMSG